MSTVSLVDVSGDPVLSESACEAICGSCGARHCIGRAHRVGASVMFRCDTCGVHSVARQSARWLTTQVQYTPDRNDDLAEAMSAARDLDEKRHRLAIEAAKEKVRAGVFGDEGGKA